MWEICEITSALFSWKHLKKFCLKFLVYKLFSFYLLPTVFLRDQNFGLRQIKVRDKGVWDKEKNLAGG